MAGREDAIERGKAKAAKAGEERAGKGGKDKKGKKGKGSGGGIASASVAGHPRARQAVRKAKGVGGLVGFGLAALLSHRAGLEPVQILERALLVGMAGYLLAWACAVTVWRHLVLAEMRAAYDAYHEPPERRELTVGDPPPPPPAG